MSCAKGPEDSEPYVTDPEGLGTAGYRAPETITHQKLGYGSDIWAMGCILFELTSGRRLFAGNYEVKQYAHTTNELETPKVLHLTKYLVARIPYQTRNEIRNLLADMFANCSLALKIDLQLSLSLQTPLTGWYLSMRRRNGV